MYILQHPKSPRPCDVSLKSSRSLRLSTWLFISYRKAGWNWSYSLGGLTLAVSRITRESEAALSVRVGSVSAWDTRRDLTSKRQQIKQLDFQMWFCFFPFLSSVILLILVFKCVVRCVSAQDRPIGLLPGFIAVDSLSLLSLASNSSPWKSISSQNSMAIPNYFWLIFYR